MPAGQEAEHRFAMGELPDEVLEICQRLAKLTEMLRGLAELFLNDLSEKTGSHDIVRLHRLILQMNRALGMFEAQNKSGGWRSGVSSGAPGYGWVTREEREGQLHLWFHCVEMRQPSAGKVAVAQYSAHYCHLRNLAFAEEFFCLQDERAERESGRPFCGAGFPL